MYNLRAQKCGGVQKMTNMRYMQNICRLICFGHKVSGKCQDGDGGRGDNNGNPYEDTRDSGLHFLLGVIARCPPSTQSS